MGEEIDKQTFTSGDFSQFQKQLVEETALLQQWFDEQKFSEHKPVGGFELEVWLVDKQIQAQAINEQFLERLNNPLVVPELAQFNVELNGTPEALEGDILSRMMSELQNTCHRCAETASELDSQLMMIGVLPTLADTDLCLENMSKMRRYAALNEQVMRLRQGRPIQLDINGREHCRNTHYNVMLEAAATSFQIHIQVPQTEALRYYNASLAISAPMLALSTNSPFLFGQSVWEETRIPLFEQSVELGGLGDASRGPLKRVSFGSGYARESLMECFTENLQHFPVLLPIIKKSHHDTDLTASSNLMAHVQMHNGTVWRWNRPLIGFNQKGEPHIRIEHRVVPAGPTVVDTVANAAMFFGLVEAVAKRDIPIEKEMEFATVKDDFYRAAKLGLQSHIHWLGKSMTAQRLILDELLPVAKKGLQQLKINDADIEYYLGIIEQRVSTGRTGSAWQRQRAEQLNGDLQAMSCDYLKWQQSGKPVHEWL